MQVSITSPSTWPSPLFRRVGIRIITFEACSDFTHVTARWIAQPPEAAFVTRLRPDRLPDQAARQLPKQSTTLRVKSSFTGGSRLRGARRVEDGRSGLGHPASPCFPSPLIKPDVPISGIRLSDWLHRKAHDEVRVRSRMSGGRCLRLAAELLPTAPGTSGVCRLSPITMPSPSSEAHQKSGSFPPPALPGLSSTMTLSESR